MAFRKVDRRPKERELRMMMTIEEHEHVDSENSYCSKRAQMHYCHATILSLCFPCIRVMIYCYVLCYTPLVMLSELLISRFARSHDPLSQLATLSISIN